MRAVGVRRLLVLLVALVVFSLNGRLPNTLLRLERVSAAAPVANNDDYTAIIGENLVIPAPGILANDTDADVGDTLSVDLLSVLELPPFISTMSPSPDGSFQYYPLAAGTDVYQYQAWDGTSLSNVATITFHIDNRPVANNDSYRTPMNTPLVITAPGVLGNDTDADNDPLIPSVVSTTTHGGLAFNSNGSFVYTPDTNFVGTDSFTYKVNDGLADSAVGTVTIKVNQVPIATADSYVIPKGFPAHFDAATGVLSNDTDPDNDTLTASLVSGPTNGSLVIFDTDGSFSYTPNLTFVGADSFTYKANDGLADSNTVTVTILVDTPPVAVNNSYSTPVNTQLTVAAPQGILANDSDGDSEPITATAITQPTHGTLTLNSDGSFTYMPNLGFGGTDHFTYKASDGKLDSNTATVTIEVTGASSVQASPVRNYRTSVPIVLTWARVSTAIGYQVEVSTSGTFSGTPVQTIDISSGDTLSTSIATLPNGFYYWRMRTQLTSITWSPWKPADSFRVSQ
jgi:VCBS repeat-containing protein